MLQRAQLTIDAKGSEGLSGMTGHGVNITYKKIMSDEYNKEQINGHSSQGRRSKGLNNIVIRKTNTTQRGRKCDRAEKRITD